MTQPIKVPQYVPLWRALISGVRTSFLSILFCFLALQSLFWLTKPVLATADQSGPLGLFSRTRDRFQCRGCLGTHLAQLYRLYLRDLEWSYRSGTLAHTHIYIYTYFIEFIDRPFWKCFESGLAMIIGFALEFGTWCWSAGTTIQKGFKNLGFLRQQFSCVFWGVQHSFGRVLASGCSRRAIWWIKPGRMEAALGDWRTPLRWMHFRFRS